MTTDRFDPVQGEPWGKCADCGLELQTYEDGKAHMTESRGASGKTSHTIRGTNRTRGQRIGSFVDQEVDDALDELFRTLDAEVENDHMTEEELLEALHYASADLVDGWKRYAAS
ncbi:hypothetical protein SEA_RASPUTIA_104 [Microbacterium phage Rasputia]|nr:hypothetical protein SEA_RASPUTIA_104 [Microbacterium phage Rasputia]